MTTTHDLVEQPTDVEAVARQRSRAVRAVAAASAGAEECAELLAALGLDPREGRRPD